MEILGITDEGLGHTSQLIGLGDRAALVVDPPRFPERQRRPAAERGWRIGWAADTHSHADYISGSLLAACGHARVSVLDGGPHDWHRVTGQALETGS